ncbi:MAG: regulatory protein RecX [Gammaproteobacteria bacterium]|nr:regulatory protein RecX [Gammaproteobacteria bacterium]
MRAKEKNPVRKGETPVQAGNRIAVGMLARREHSRQEIGRKLGQRGLDEDVIEQVLAGLEAEGLLSEERFVEQFVYQRVNRGDGPMKIRLELGRRGIDGEVVDIAIDAAEVDWQAQAESARQKRFGREIPAEYSERAKQARFLQGRGFGMEQISRVLKGDLFEE